MSHEFESGLFVQTPAWHRLGTVIENAPTTTEAIKIARLEWRVDTVPIYLGGESEPIKGWRATQRDSDHRVLGIVGERYTPLQNIDAFRFFDPFLHEGEACIESCGSLKQGEKVWILAKIAGCEDTVSDGDRMRGYLLLYNSHDGTLAVNVCFTPIRVVCWNTLSAAISEGNRNREIVKVRHTSSIAESMKMVQRSIDFARRTFSVSVDMYREMMRHKLDIDGLKKYVRDVWEVPNDVPDMPRAWETVEYLAARGSGTDIPGVKGTVYGGYNAVTEFIEHHRGRSDESRLAASWLGEGKILREKAFVCAKTLAGITTNKDDEE